MWIFYVKFNTIYILKYFDKFWILNWYFEENNIFTKNRRMPLFQNIWAYRWIKIINGYF